MDIKRDPYSMATSAQKNPKPSLRRPWSNLPPELLSVVSNFIDYEIDHLRLRSVCSPWRSSVPPRPTIFSLPQLLLPAPFSSACSPSTTVYCNLEETISYRLSSPSHSPDPSKPNAWLFRASQTNPNTFALKHPLFPSSFPFPPGLVPTRLNLLHYRISEISRCYRLNLFDGASTPLTYPLRKIIVRRERLVNSVLMLHYAGGMSYWSPGDEYWTPVKLFTFCDVILHRGKFYAVDESGVLVSFDSEFKMSVEATAVRDDAIQFRLVELGSELLLVSTSFPLKTDVTVSKLNKCNGKWDPISDLGDAVLVMGVNSSFSASTKDYHGWKGNRVYLYNYVELLDGHGVYHLDERRLFALSKAEDFGEMFLPGTWLSTATSD